MKPPILGLEWDDGNFAKCQKHGVSPEEIEDVLDDMEKEATRKIDGSRRKWAGAFAITATAIGSQRTTSGKGLMASLVPTDGPAMLMLGIGGATATYSWLRNKWASESDNDEGHEKHLKSDIKRAMEIMAKNRDSATRRAARHPERGLKPALAY